MDHHHVIDLLGCAAKPVNGFRRQLAADLDAALVSVAHLDAEVLSALARLHRADQLDADEVSELLERLATMDMRRVPIIGELLAAAWNMRDDRAARLDGFIDTSAAALAFG